MVNVYGQTENYLLFTDDVNAVVIDKSTNMIDEVGSIALLSSLQAYTQAIPQIAAGGGDASQIVSKIAQVIRARQKGQSIEDAIEEIFAPVEQVPPAGAPMVEQPSPAPAGAPVGGAITPGPEAGGVPDIMSLLAGLR